MAGDRWVGASSAESEGFGFTPFFLGEEPSVVSALRSLASGLLILSPFPLPVFRQGGVGLGPAVWRGFGGIPGLEVFPGGFSCCLLLVLRGVSSVGWIGDGEAELEGMAYCTWRRIFRASAWRSAVRGGSSLGSMGSGWVEWGYIGLGAQGTRPVAFGLSLPATAPPTRDVPPGSGPGMES